MRIHCVQHLKFQNGIKTTATETCKSTFSLRNKMLPTQV